MKFMYKKKWKIDWDRWLFQKIKNLFTKKKRKRR